MAIFSRRTLQRLLDENSNFLTELQLKEHIKRLNQADMQSIDTEWEVAFLNAFSKLGNITHEPDFIGTNKKVDLLFHPSNAFDQAFIADIATVSTSGRDDDNPIWSLQKELVKRVRKANLNPGNFSFDVGGEMRGKRGKQSMELKLPQQKEFELIFNEDFQIFLKKCSIDINNPNVFSIKTDSLEISIKFVPGQEFVSIGSPNYKAIYSLTRNPISNALNRKHEQLKEINENILKGIILCSSNYNFSHLIIKSSTYDFSIKDIILHFLRQNKSIGFVLTASAEEYRDYIGKRKVKIASHLYINNEVKIGEESVKILSEVVKYLPNPVSGGINAVHRLNWLKGKSSKSRQEGESFYGGYTICDDTIKISLRGLQELLANRVSPQDWSKDYRNYFFNKFFEGKIIENINRQHCSEEDDDWIEISFGQKITAFTQFSNNKLIESCGDYIKISLRALQLIMANLHDILANQASPKIFLESLHNYFENRLLEGKMIEQFIVHKGSEADDWVEIRFGRKDPAISKFSYNKV